MASSLDKTLTVSLVLRDFWREIPHIKHGRNKSADIKNKTIQFARSATKPVGMLNNTTYPLPRVNREESPHGINLNWVQTPVDVVRRVLQQTRAYSMTDSRLQDQRECIQDVIGRYGLNKYAPASADATKYTSLIATTGATDVGTHRLATLADLQKLATAFDADNVPAEGRAAAVPAEVLGAWATESITLHNQLLTLGPQDPLYLAGFRIYRYQYMPYYAGGETIKEWDAVPEASDHKAMVVAWHRDHVGYGLGGTEVFMREKDPEEQADLFSMIQFFFADSLAGMYSKALIGAPNPGSSPA